MSANGKGKSAKGRASTRRRWLGSVILALLLFNRAAALAEAPQVKQSRVLVLHSYHQGFTWTDNVSKGIEAVFDEMAVEVELIFEFMDVKRIYSDAYLIALRDFYRAKYAERHIDLIIASDDHALEFLLNAGQELFPGVPVVFCAINGYDAARHSSDGRELTGVVETIDIRATLEAALALHPEARHVAVISDRTLTGKALLERAEPIFQDYAERVQFITLEHLTMAQLQREVDGLPPDTFIFAFIFSQDQYGRVFSHEYNLARLAEHAQMPIYSVWEFYLGHGLVGGMLTSGQAHGETAARMAARILRGERASEIPVVMDSPNRYMFDYEQMTRFNLNPGALPEGSIIINREPTFYESYSSLIWTVVGIFGFQLAIILTLVRNVERRRQAEEQVRSFNEALESRIAERTTQLEAANTELEAFAYSVSHDLRAPLRAMDGFSRILLEEHAAQLPPQAQRYLQMVCDNAGHMEELINDLLAFSRLGRQPLRKTSTLPHEIAQQALEELETERRGRQVAVTIAEMPACHADPALLKQMYVNLLSNALKFTRSRKEARIEAGARQQNGTTVYFVRDNGVGFDMRYADKLFGVFQRLHRAEDFEGTGVGLAIVQRIIHRHGGRVWAQAVPNQGATFFFTINCDEQEAAGATPQASN